MAKNKPVEEILEMTIVDKLELQVQDIIALGKVINDDMPFVIEPTELLIFFQALAVSENTTYMTIVLASTYAVQLFN